LDGAARDGPASQKKSLRASEQDNERVAAQRQFWQRESRHINPAQFVFVDESGITTEMTRRYGRALNGARVDEGVPAGNWRTLTVLGAVSVSGWVAVMSIESPTDGDVFLAYLKEVLCPQLKPGQLVVMDNLGAHKVDGVREIIKQTGASLCYLPPYSPDFNPIEKCWAQMKQKLRALKARSVTTLQQALGQALATLTPQNAANYFRHCGYSL
jgi:transposase